MLVCEDCGSKEIEILAWVDANTNEYKSDGTDYHNDRWCQKCDGHVKFVTEAEFEEASNV